MIKKRPQVSIVIPAFNEEKYLARCLASLINQETGFKFEVIVVDNNSTDKTVEIAKKFKNKLNLEIIKESKQGRGAARAKGFNEALGNIILSTDADTILSKDWIENLVKPIKWDILATSGTCKVLDSSKVTNTFFSFFQPKSMVCYRFIFGHFWLSGFSFAILKSAYKKAGGFNTRLQSQEDTELSFRVAKIGKIAFVNRPVTVSGRRFRNGLIAGLYQYVFSFTKTIFLKQQNAILSNVR